MRILLYTLIIFIPLKPFAQADHLYKGQVFSVIDSLPLSHFNLRVNDALLQTDSAGFFSFGTSRNKAKLSAHFGHYAYDKIILLRKNNGLIKLYCIKTYDSISARYDIQQGTMWLFCGVSFAPTAVSPADIRFQKQYCVNYYVIGDFIPFPLADLTSYNAIIAKYLDKKYGTGWRAAARTNVVGMPGPGS